MPPTVAAISPRGAQHSTREYRSRLRLRQQAKRQSMRTVSFAKRGRKPVALPAGKAQASTQPAEAPAAAAAAAKRSANVSDAAPPQTRLQGDFWTKSTPNIKGHALPERGRLGRNNDDTGQGLSDDGSAAEDARDSAADNSDGGDDDKAWAIPDTPAASSGAARAAPSAKRQSIVPRRATAFGRRQGGPDTAASRSVKLERPRPPRTAGSQAHAAAESSVARAARPDRSPSFNRLQRRSLRPPLASTPVAGSGSHDGVDRRGRGRGSITTTQSQSVGRAPKGRIISSAALVRPPRPKHKPAPPHATACAPEDRTFNLTDMAALINVEGSRSLAEESALRDVVLEALDGQGLRDGLQGLPKPMHKAPASGGTAAGAATRGVVSEAHTGHPSAGQLPAHSNASSTTTPRCGEQGERSSARAPLPTTPPCFLLDNSSDDG